MQPGQEYTYVPRLTTAKIVCVGTHCDTLIQTEENDKNEIDALGVSGDSVVVKYTFSPQGQGNYAVAVRSEDSRCAQDQLTTSTGHHPGRAANHTGRLRPT